MITVIDRNSLRLISDEILKALQPLEKQLGVKFTNNRGSYGFSHGYIKLEIATIKNGKVQSTEATDFKGMASMFGLKPSHLGKTFESQGREFKIVGLKPNRSKFPILATSAGKRFKFSAEVVKAALEKLTH